MKFDPRRLAAGAYPFAMTVEPRFADMDIVKHINNLAVAEYYEEARVRFLMEVLGEDFLFRAREFRLLVARASYDYLHEARYPTPLEVRAGIARLGRSSFDLAMALFQDERCIGLADVVKVHLVAGKPAPLPAELRAQLESRALRLAPTG
ncbi:acyl-CoA thioesterase [Denitratisoma sp. DHT3]|uniref:acyl-CoA thioesterase n=1 Tax=Denitratisoma sp. DHT3 TaxID=1981880 RepID=UPI0016469370|nr:thioesterase family protein [Denitratisoma sp. DHT3]